MESVSEQEITIETPKVTRLIIEKDIDVCATGPDQKPLSGIKGISISRDKSNPGYDYYKLLYLSRTKKVSIILREKDEGKEIKLPSDMLQRMAEYLAKKAKMKEPFDCASFVHAINGIPYDYGHFYPHKWEITDLNNSMDVGSSVAFTKRAFLFEKNKYTHLAIYLGDGLYLSKNGTDNALFVTDIDTLRKLYGNGKIYKLKPKKEFVEPLCS